MQNLTQFLKDSGPWASAIVGAILVKMLHKAIRMMEKRAETAVKADLAFEEVSTRVPEYLRRFETWKSHR